MDINLNSVITLLSALIGLILTAGIFLFAFQAFLLRGINAIVDAKTEPLKKELSEFKSEVRTFQKEVTDKLDRLLNKH